jgi:hypothetical protein
VHGTLTIALSGFYRFITKEADEDFSSANRHGGRRKSRNEGWLIAFSFHAQMQQVPTAVLCEKRCTRR